MKVKEAREMYVTIQNLMIKKLPIRMAFSVQKNAKKLQEIVEFADKKQNELIDKYAKKDDDGNYMQSEDGKGILIDNSKEFLSEMNELSETDMPIEFEKINIMDVERCDEERFDPLTPAELNIIESMLEE